MTSPSIVRAAKPDDHNEIWRLFLMVHNENGVFPLAPQKVDYFLQRALNPGLIPDGDVGVRGAIGVIGPVGALEGFVFVTIGCYWYTESKHVEEYAVFVDPEYRRSGHAQALVQWMKDQVETTRLPLVTGIMSNHRTEAKCRLYRRMLPKVGEFFLLFPKGSTMPVTLGSS